MRPRQLDNIEEDVARGGNNFSTGWKIEQNRQQLETE